MIPILMLICGFLFISGAYSIIQAIQHLPNAKQSQPSPSSLETKFFKWNGPAGFVYGIVAILIGFGLIKYESNDKSQELIRTLSSKNAELTHELESFKQSQPMISTFNLELRKDEPKSILGGSVLITYNDEPKRNLIFKGSIGVSSTKTGPFDKNQIEIEYGDKLYLKLENGEVWGLNILKDVMRYIKIEFYKIEDSY